eukprot:c20549_g2_i1.p1 GENE.c20549_g2_i1~~c20549_g2_i1.p1  ORF type:complete len:369 (-),score=106.95 c20549_g2_i1:139-1158(-)
MQNYCSSGLLYDPPSSPESETFTALGLICYACPCLVLPQMIGVWDFETKTVQSFGIPLNIKSNSEGGIFPRDLFPEFKGWGRKGFLHTRWIVNGNVLDIVNCHLFHDASNTECLGKTDVSVYAKCRHRAYDHVIRNLTLAEAQNIILFGDFNFRLHLKGVIDLILNSKEKENNIREAEDLGEDRDEPEKPPPVVVEKKLFKLSPEFFKFFTNQHKNLQKHDVEKMTVLKNPIHVGLAFAESTISFPPTYPYEEEKITNAKLYPFGNTRCPSWCDRVFYSTDFKKNVDIIKYDIMGKNVCVGDHKPVFLRCSLDGGKKTSRSLRRSASFSSEANSVFSYR